MIVFAHGYDVTPDTYAPLLDAWAQAGFVVVAPFFPDEQASAVAAQHGANTEDDLVNEPEDLTFVTRSILQASANESSGCAVVSGLVEPSEIALAGHSDGATAAGMLAYDHGDDPQGVNYADLRSGIDYRAVVILSGAEDTVQSYAAQASRPNLLVIQSLADQCNPIRDDVKLYDAIHQPNKWFLELRTAHHLPPFDGTDLPAFRVVVATSISFLQLSLDDSTTSSTLLVDGNQHPSVARLYGAGHGPSLEHAPRIAESCGPN
jgi:pimeloyl-ACP methyl ester carboxylesterase